MTLPRMKATVILSKAALVLPIIGDLVETGVNTGTSSCLMMRMMMRFDNCNRRLWAFDSFEGLPNPTGEDGVWGMGAHKGHMAVSQELFEANMKRWGAWNETRIVVTKGLFNETLPSSHIGKISFLRLDGDLFASTWDALTNLYHKVVSGGYIYVDDFGSFEACREAITRSERSTISTSTLLEKRIRSNTSCLRLYDGRSGWWRSSRVDSFFISQTKVCNFKQNVSQ